MTPKCKTSVHCNTQHDATCFVPRPQIMLDIVVLNLVCFDMLNDWDNVYS
jgi:hypothetical protein